MPLFQLPQLITQLVNARVAITRLQQFLAAPQKPPADYLQPAETGARASAPPTMLSFMVCQQHRTEESSPQVWPLRW